jgi:putative oxidoreductase
VLSSGIFCVAGFAHLFHPERIVPRLEAAPFAHLALALGPAPVLVSASGLVLAAGGVALLLGLCTRGAALALMLVLLPITLTVQLSPAHIGPLFKNIGLFGGLLHFALQGAGVNVPSLDNWLSSRRARVPAEVAS